MYIKKLILVFLVISCMLMGCEYKKTEDWVRGVDVSSIISLEQSGVVYYNRDGKQEDLFDILEESGVNYIRIRVFNDPYKREKNGNIVGGYGGGNSDLEKAKEISIRASKHHMKVMIDFHYSDFWADPGKQKEPKDWIGLSFEEKKQKIYQYTYDSLIKLKGTGATIGMVQLGNEITSGLAGETDYDRVCELLKKAAEAVKKVDSNINVVLHVTNPEKKGLFEYLSGMYEKHGVDYDIFATSYYPAWHGTIKNLKEKLEYIHKTYGKKIMIAEMAYPYTLEDGDGHPNSIHTKDGLPYEVSKEGQTQAIIEVKNLMRSFGEAGVGFFYWEPAWIPVGNKTMVLENQRRWETYGSGWASSFAAEYDQTDAKKWFGGCAVENQALFDFNGHVLPALDCFLE